MRLSIIPVAAVIALSACVTPPREYDPFAGIGLNPDRANTETPLKRVRLALLLNENTKESMRYTNKQGSHLQQGIDFSFIYNDTIALLQRHFASVVKVDAASDVPAGKADLIAVLDILAKTPRSAFNEADIRVGAHFLEPNEELIAQLQGRGTARPNKSGGFVGFIAAGGPKGVKRAAKEAFDQALAQFEAAMTGSEPLLAAARAAAGAAPAAVAAAPAAPEQNITSDVDRPAYAAGERADDFALVIGIGDYKDLPDAQFAERDAAAVAAHMRALGVPQRHVVHLAGSDASYISLKKYLDSWLPRNVKPESRVYFFFSGHGAPDVKTGDAYLVPWDGDPGFLKDTAYPVQRLYDRLAKLPAKEVLVALDACFSGAGGRSVLAEGARPLVTKVDLGTALDGKLTLLTAASGDEITTTIKEQGHGIFTYFFLKGLNGAAGDAKGKVTAGSLYRYLKPKVQDEARLQNREQTPTVRYARDVVFR